MKRAWLHKSGSGRLAGIPASLHLVTRQCNILRARMGPFSSFLSLAVAKLSCLRWTTGTGEAYGKMTSLSHLHHYVLAKLKLAWGTLCSSITFPLQLQLPLNSFSGLCFPKSVKDRCLAGANSMAYVPDRRQRERTVLTGVKLLPNRVTAWTAKSMKSIQTSLNVVLYCPLFYTQWSQN